MPTTEPHDFGDVLRTSHRHRTNLPSAPIANLRRPRHRDFLRRRSENPIAREFNAKAPFAFNGKIDQVHVIYLGTSAEVNEEKRDLPIRQMD